MVNKYIRIYHKRNISLGLTCATIVFVPFFVISLFYDVVSEDILISFVPFVLAAVYVAIASLFTIRFRKMIEEQEQLYKVKFQDTDVVHLETTLYLSKEWLIWAGSCAVYRKHVKSISSSLRHGQVGSSNEVTIKTIDNKQYTVWCISPSNVEKIKQWKNSENAYRLYSV